MDDLEYKQGYRFDKGEPYLYYHYERLNRMYHETQYWVRYQKLLNRWTFVIFFIMIVVGVPLAYNDFQSVTFLEVAASVAFAVFGGTMSLALSWFFIEIAGSLRSCLHYTYRWLMAKD